MAVAGGCGNGNGNVAQSPNETPAITSSLPLPIEPATAEASSPQYESVGSAMLVDEGHSAESVDFVINASIIETRSGTGLDIDVGDLRLEGLRPGRTINIMYRVTNKKETPYSYEIYSYFESKIRDYDSCGDFCKEFVDAPISYRDWISINGIKYDYVHAANEDVNNLLNALQEYRVQEQMTPKGVFSSHAAGVIAKYLASDLIGTYEVTKMGEIISAEGWENLHFIGGRWMQEFETLSPGETGGSILTFATPEDAEVLGKKLAFQTGIAVSTGYCKSGGLRTWWLVHYK